MSAHCQLTGRRPGFGNAISHSHRRTRRRFDPASPATSPEDRLAAQAELQRQPRDASATRVRNRDAVDGRPRGYLRAFGLSRIGVRQQAHAGFLPGVRKASW
ncbi:30S ribosomal protein S14 [Kitasatospora sp. NPDC028055]|uniref:30S ribosomal protein S14 n=1 Tax=Kitasatospora sp. NPDC028055 TaxID=3155653 RepID=UPI0033ED2E8D